MITFLIKGLFRDPSRSVFPIIIITLGAFLTCLLEGYITGAYNNMLDSNIRFSTGHVKVMTEGYSTLSHQSPNDLALLDVDELSKDLKKDFPAVTWTKRISFAGLLDIPDKNRETKAQGPVAGMAINLFDDTANSDLNRLKLNESLIQGRLPSSRAEIVISEYLFQQFNLSLGDEATLLTTSADGATVASNFTVVGTLSFGIQALDRSMIIADVAQMQYVLNMDNSVGELFGFLKNDIFDDQKTLVIEEAFKKANPIIDEFSPVMLSLRNQNMLAEMIDMGKSITTIVIVVFVLLVTIVIWNTRLIANLRRYGEIGVRLAIGESKKRLLA